MTLEEINAIVDGVSRPLIQQLRAAQERISELEQRIATIPVAVHPPPPVDVQAIAKRAAALIRQPQDGKDAPPVDMDALVLRVAELIPAPQPGKDAPPVDVNAIEQRVIESVRPLIGSEIRSAVDALPKPEKGEKGDPGEVPDVVQWLRTNTHGVADIILARIPKPQDGAPGKDGRSVDPAEIQAMIDTGIKVRFADWAVDQERRAHDVFQRAIDRMPMPKDGKDGRDGLGFDDFEMHDDGAGTVTLSFKRGELEKSRMLKFPWPDHCGIWRDGQAYKYGNNVTWAGSVWRCLAATTIQKPGNGASDWQLIVKRGEDGRPGKDGEKGERGPQGPPGRDLTQMNVDGSKY